MRCLQYKNAIFSKLKLKWKVGVKKKEKKKNFVIW